MDYREFVEAVKKELEKLLGGGYMIRINTVMKNNRKPLDTMAIMREGENASPAIYLELYYRRFSSGVPLQEIARQILEFYRENRVVSSISIDYFTDFNNVRSQIVCKLVNCEKNRYLLEHIPHRHFLDLVLIFYFNMDHELLGRGGVRIQNSHLKMWGITEDELFSAALSNCSEYMKHELMGLPEMIEDMMGFRIDPDPMQLAPMYVLTNEDRCFGAAVITLPHVLEEVALELQDDFYVLPSSIHECMIIPVHSGCDMSCSELRRMVCEINRAHVSEDEILGDSIYRYFAAKRELCVVADAESDG